MNDLEKTKKDLEQVTKEKILAYLDAFGFNNNLTEKEQLQFIEIATAYQLNPFKREIYCVPYMSNVKQPDGSWIQEKKLSIITGYEVYLKRAERLNLLNGWNVKVEGEQPNLKAIVTIYRKDWEQPFVHDVFFEEYNQDNKMWKSKPITMIKKVCIAQGFRMAFPDEMGGMPYTQEELPSNMIEHDIIETKMDDKKSFVKTKQKPPVQKKTNNYG